MATLKIVLKINWKDVAGWSETYFKETTATDLYTATLTALANSFSDRRRLVLTDQARIVGVRISFTATPTVFRLVKMNKPGQRTGFIDASTPDVPNVAVLATMTSVSGAIRQFLMRGLIDEDVTLGNFSAAFSGPAVYNTWFDYLGNNGFQIRDLIAAAPTAVVLVNGPNGTLTTTIDSGIAVGSLVTVKTRTSGNGKSVRWTGRVIAHNGVSLTLKNWTWGDCEGGTIVSNTISYSAIVPFTVVIPQRARTRQTGRPFDLLRGRASNRN